MAPTNVSRQTTLNQEAAFALVTTWELHRVPFTSVVDTTDGFIARTQLGPLGFDDPMMITAWDRPRSVKIVKTGRVIRGWAVIEVESTGEGSTVTWTEDLSLVFVPRFAQRLVDGATKLMLRRILDQIFDGH